jgi:large subunit ribosomal protein L19
LPGKNVYNATLSELQLSEESNMSQETNEKHVDASQDSAAAQPAAVTTVSAAGAYIPVLRTDIPELRSGDEIKVYYRVVEGGKERTQGFEGTIIALKRSGITKTITVKKTSFGISVERIFPLNSKLVQKIEVKKHQKVRRSKLYYLRALKGKASRLKELR